MHFPVLDRKNRLLLTLNPKKCPSHSSFPNFFLFGPTLLQFTKGNNSLHYRCNCTDSGQLSWWLFANKFIECAEYRLNANSKQIVFYSYFPFHKLTPTHTLLCLLSIHRHWTSHLLDGDRKVPLLLAKLHALIILLLPHKHSSVLPGLSFCLLWLE